MTITWKIEIDWDGDGSYAYDEAARVTALAVERGRSDEFDEFAAGKCVLTLGNHDRRFDPWYVSSPLYGKVLPRRGVLVKAIDNAQVTGVELLTNGGMETVTGTDDDNVSDTFSGWTNESVADLADRRVEASATCYVGARSAKLFGYGRMPQMYQDVSGITPGLRYLLSFYGRSDGIISMGAAVYAMAPTYTEIGSVYFSQAAFAQILCPFTAPAGCTTVRVKLFTGLEQGTAYFDGVSLQAYGYEYPVFAGRIEEIEPSGAIGNRTALLTAYDGLRDLAAVDMPSTLQKSITTDAAIDAVLDTAGWATADRDLDVGNDTLGYWWTPGGQNAKSLCADLAKSEFGAFFMTARGLARFINRQNYNTGAALGTLDQADIADLQLKQPWDAVWNVVSIRCNPIKLESTSPVWILQDRNVYVEPGGSVELWAEYQDVNSAPCAGENVITPVATTDYTANTIAGGGGTDMTADMSVAAYIYSTWAQLTVSNTHATAGFYITFLQIRGDVIGTTPTVVRRQDATSQASYGKRSLTVDVPWQQSVNTAADLANTLLAFYKNPKMPVVCMLDNVIPDTLMYDLCDRLSVTIAEYNIDQTMRIHALALKTGLTMQDLKASYTLGATDEATYWLLGEAGISELGDTTRLGY